MMMKALVLLFGLVAAANAQSEGWCRCSAFVTYDRSEIMVYESNEIPIDSCTDDARQCKNECLTQLNAASDHGNLWYLTESGVTVGQQVCTYLADHFMFFIHNHKVYGYFEVCGGAWEYTGVASEGYLCCNGGRHEHCITRE